VLRRLIDLLLSLYYILEPFHSPFQGDLRA